MGAPGTVHAADSQDLIQVHGARENNLKGSCKSSLVFATIAAESWRLINERSPRERSVPEPLP